MGKGAVRAARRGIVAVFVAGWLLALLPGVARAATLTVCTQGPPTCQYSFLQLATNAAQDGDTISIAAGDYTGQTGSAVISASPGTTKHLRLVGAGADVTLLDGALRTMLSVGFGVTVDLSGVTLTGGHAGGTQSVRGGGIYNRGTAHVTDCIITGNHADFEGYGGGIYNDGVMTLTNTTVSNNTAAYHGGGIANFYLGSVDSPGRLTITNSAISGNSANGEGGGIFNGSQVALSNVTLSGNSAGQGGGGIAEGVNTLTNVTISGNTAPTGGGVYGGVLGGLPLTANNTIIAGNTGPTNPDLSGVVVSGGHNLIGGDPRLDVLGRSTGETTDTMALLPGSPALDAGDDAICAAPLPTGPLDPPGAGGVDQRGVPRPWAAHCDIGAFEARYTLTVTGGGSQSAIVGQPFAKPLAIALSNGDGLPDLSGGPVTFTAPASGASAIITGSPATTDASGAASVTATANGTAGSYTVTASMPGANSVPFSLTNLAPTITLSPTALPAGTRGVAYPQTVITATGGTGSTPPFTFAVTQGSLPPGLALSATGTLSGTPTQAGTFAFTVTATDANGYTGSQAYTVTVSPAPLVSIAVTPANGTLKVGGTRQYTAMGTYQDGSQQDLTGQVAWGSDNSAVAKPDGLKPGEMVAVAPGTTRITATLGGIVGQTGVTVTSGTAVGVAPAPPGGRSSSPPSGAGAAPTPNPLPSGR